MKRFFSLLFLICLFAVSGYAQISTKALDGYGYWGTGYYSKIVFKDNYAICLAYTSGVDIIDVSDPTNPVFVSNFFPTSTVYDIAIIGNYLYLAEGYVGIEIVDVSDVSNPELYQVKRDSYINLQKIASKDNYLFVLKGTTMYVYDESTPGSFSYAGSYSIGVVYKMHIYGNYLYYISGDDLKVLDISDVGNIFEVGSYTSSALFDVVVYGNYAYLSSRYNSTVEVLNISDLTSITKITSFSLTSANSMAVTTGFLAIASLNSVYLYDISDPSSPSQIGSFSYLLFSAYPYLAFNSGYLFGAMQGYGLRIFSYDSQGISEVAKYSRSGLSNDFAISGDIAAVAMYPTFVRILDISDPLNPAFLSEIGPIYYPQTVVIKDSYLIIGQDSKINVYDISNPSSPSFVTSISSNQNLRMLMYGNYLYCNNASSTVNVYDISDPSAISSLGSFDIGATPTSMKISNGLLFCGFASNGLKVYDLTSSPTNPTLVADRSDIYTYSMDIDGNTLYAGEFLAGRVNVWDISDISNITLVKQLSLATYGIMSLKHFNNNLFFFSNGYLYNYDISDLDNPRKLQEIKSVTGIFKYNMDVYQSAQGDYLIDTLDKTGRIEVREIVNWHEIISSAGTNGIISPLGSIFYKEGDSATYTITPDYGYHIKSVLVDGVDVGAVESYTFSNITAPHTIDAVFEINTYTVTFLTNGNGSLVGETVQTVTHGSDCSPVEAVPDTYYQFVGWSGDYTGTENPLTVTNVTSDMTITANFEPVAEFTITAIAHEGGSINPSGSVRVKKGESQTFTITPDEGYFISKVLIDGENAGRINEYTFEYVFKDHTIEAYFSTSLPPEITKAYADSTLSTSPREVKFICEAYDPDGGKIKSYQWDVSRDGELVDSVITYTGECNYTFTQAGSYSIKVTVFDDEGESASAVLKDNQDSVSDVIIFNPSDLKIAVPVPVTIAAKEENLTIENIKTRVINPLAQSVDLTIEFYNNEEKTGETTVTIPANGLYIIDPQKIEGDFTDIMLVSDGYLVLSTDVITSGGKMSAYVTPVYSGELIIPHIAESTEWWDSSLVICDLSPKDVYININEEEYQHTNLYYSNIISLDGFIAEGIDSSASWGKILSTSISNPFEERENRLTGFETFVHNGTDGAAVELQAMGHTTMFIPHIPEETDIFWTGFAFVNPNETDTNVIVSFYTSDGEYVGSKQITLPAQSKLSDLMKNMFNEYFGKADWGIIESDLPIVGIEIYGTQRDGICGFSLPYIAQSNGILPNVFIGAEEWSGVSIANVGTKDAHVVIQLMDKDGNVKAEKQETLASKSRFKFVVSDYFEGVELEEGDYIRYTSDGSLISIVVNGDLSRTYMTALTGIN